MMMQPRNLVAQGGHYYPQQHQHQQRRRFIEPVRYKTRMCRHWETTGHCPFAPRCAFAHGNEELRTVTMNAEEGLLHLSKLREYQERSIGGCQASMESGLACECEECMMMQQQQQHIEATTATTTCPPSSIPCPCAACMGYATTAPYPTAPYPYSAYPAYPPQQVPESLMVDMMTAAAYQPVAVAPLVPASPPTPVATVAPTVTNKVVPDASAPKTLSIP
eukprot:PhF_6_TR35098/c0_g1_i1/m.51152